MASFTPVRTDDAIEPAKDDEIIGDDAPPRKRGMHYAQALEQVGGDESLLQRMIGQFVDCTAKACARMEGFVEASEWESLRLDAHSLKGASGYVHSEVQL